jgi:hypothetical protein
MTPGSRRALLAVVALLAVAGAVTAGTALAAGDATAFAQQEPLGEDANTTTVIKVALQGDSDARWTITEHFNVSSPADRRAFETVAARFDSGQSAQLGLPTFRLARDRVASTVGRDMRIHQVQRETSVQDGTLQLSFTWTNFARENNETRIVDDAFTVREGTWFNRIGPGESFVIELPRGSAIDTPKAVTDGTIRWNGPAEFQPGELQISYTADPPPAVPQWLWGIGVAVLVFAVVGVVGGYILSRRESDLSLPGVPLGTDEDDGEERPPTSETTSAPAEETADESADDDGVDRSLLSDEERVEYLIEQNGGRMKQANIVKETGWSNAKVSQLLSSMEEEGRIAKLRIGRENLISFPDEDIGEFEDR